MNVITATRPNYKHAANPPVNPATNLLTSGLDLLPPVSRAQIAAEICRNLDKLAAGIKRAPSSFQRDRRLAEINAARTDALLAAMEADSE